MLYLKQGDYLPAILQHSLVMYLRAFQSPTLICIARYIYNVHDILDSCCYTTSTHIGVEGGEEP